MQLKRKWLFIRTSEIVKKKMAAAAIELLSLKLILFKLQYKFKNSLSFDEFKHTKNMCARAKDAFEYVRFPYRARKKNHPTHVIFASKNFVYLSFILNRNNKSGRSKANKRWKKTEFKEHTKFFISFIISFSSCFIVFNGISTIITNSMVNL